MPADELAQDARSFEWNAWRKRVLILSNSSF